MTKRNNFKLVGKGSRKIINKQFSNLLLDYYLEECKLKVVIQEIYGEKLNVLVHSRAQEDFSEKEVIARFQNASDMFKFLQGYYTCLKNLKSK